MNYKAYLNKIKKDLVVVYDNLDKLDFGDIDLLIYGVISDINEKLYRDKILKKQQNKPQSNINLAMIEERIYPEDYIQRAKYMLARLRFHYPNYKKTCSYIMAQINAGKNRNFKYLGIPPFEFHALNEDIRFYKRELKGELKEFRSIFEDYFLNRLSLAKYAEKHFNDGSARGKKRAENLLNRFYSKMAKVLELEDIAKKLSSAVPKIDNEEFKIYQLIKEMNTSNKIT